MRTIWTFTGLLILGCATSFASEVVLYDNADCAGSHRFLIASEADLDRTEFGNDAASVQVIAGTWTFYRDDNFQSNNGPSITMSAGGCVNMGAGPAAQFPPNLMDSVQLTQAAPGPDVAIIVFDGTGFQGAYRVLTASTTDLDAVEFDNRIASLQVQAGAWRIFRDDGFQSGNGQPVDANGNVDDIEQLGFPRDQASSVMRLNVASDPPAPPPPQVAAVRCAPGSATNGAACVDCASLGLLLARDLSACRCPTGQRTVGTRLLGGVSVELCQPEMAAVTPPQVAPPSGCDGDEVMIGSIETGGGCLPCPEFSAPNATHTQCQCVGGFQQVGIGSYGVPVCSPESGAETPSLMVEHVVKGWNAFEVASRRGFSFTAISQGNPVPPYCINPASDGVPDDTYAIAMEPLPGGGQCTFSLFGDRGLSDPWAFVSWQVDGQCGPIAFQIARADPANPRNMQHRIEMQASPTDLWLCHLTISYIVLRGPSGADPLDAFR